MASDSCFATKEQIDEQIYRSPWAEYPLPPLHKACRDGDVQSLLYLLIQGDRLEVFRSVNEQDQFLMWTPAHWAAYFGQLECIMRLVSCGLNLDVTDGRLQQTSVHLAAFSGNALVLDWVLQAGANVDKKDGLGETAVHKAVRGGNTECLNVLHRHGAKMNVVNSSLQTPNDVARFLKMNQCLEFFKSLNGYVNKHLKRSHDGLSMDHHVKRKRNDLHNINVSVSSVITNGESDVENQQKLLAMMEANGQYPLINGDHHTDHVNGHAFHGDMNGEMQHHGLNGDSQHLAMNGNMQHQLMNGNTHTHSINGVVSNSNGDTDMHLDNSTPEPPMLHSFHNQTPQKCTMLLGGHFH